MMTNELTMSVGNVMVHTTNNRGFTPEEVASRCVDRIISISDQANPVLQQQAHAFKTNIEKLVAGYIKEAIQSDRTTIYNALNDAGEPKLAELIRRL
jgi:uncharacterized phage protein gp47/JayE|tara:strand:- start:631 stop:921 length:291 start_codon:yes stop_codon:yes gene_type:complete